jgi:LmbE family N-acetylglucosaminyl deacetylase
MLKIPTVSFLLFFLVGVNTAIADPCSNDPSYCYDPGSTDFSNPFHYVFVGVHPDDELMIYPLMKDHCAESNAYCAMLIGGKGRTGCQGLSYNDCAVQRTGELHNSAIYLESDVWLYDLPSGTEIGTNPSLQDIRNIYNQKAYEAGYIDMVDFFKQRFTALLSPAAPLVVITLHPVHGNTGNSEHKVMGEFVESAVNSLQSQGVSIVVYFSDSVLDWINNKPYLRNNDNSYVECRNGSSYLTKTNTNKTNFEVFNHGYNNIYPGQKFHLGDNYTGASSYNFCYE